jgi:hypothetical protein
MNNNLSSLTFDDGNESSVRKVVFEKLKTMDNVQSNSSHV